MPNTYWNTFYHKYGGNDVFSYFTRNPSTTMNAIVSETPYSMACKAEASIGIPYDWCSIAGTSFKNDSATGRQMRIGEGMSVIFKLNRDMKFGDLNGYNGMVSFCWVNNNSSFLNSFDTAFPESLNYTIYDKQMIIDTNLIEHNNTQFNSNLTGGGYGTLIEKNENDYGFSITLFPDEGKGVNGVAPNGSIHKGTTRVSCYKACIKKYPRNFDNDENGRDVIVEKGYLSRSIDLSCETTLSIYPAFDSFHVYINGSKVCVIPLADNSNYEQTPNSINEFRDSCQFGMCVMGAVDSCVDFEIKNITCGTVLIDNQYGE